MCAGGRGDYLRGLPCGRGPRGGAGVMRSVPLPAKDFVTYRTVQLYMIVPTDWTGGRAGAPSTLQLYRVQLQTYGLRFYSSLRTQLCLRCLQSYI